MGRPPKNASLKPVISAQEAEGIKQDLDTLKDMAGAGEMKETTGYSPTAQIDDICVDKESIKKKIDILTKQLDYHKNQRETDPIKRRELHARRKWLEDKFAPVLETFRDLGVVKRDSPDWHTAYQKAIDRPKYEHYIAEWKRIGIKLEPDDPSINNLDRLRKEG